MLRNNDISYFKDKVQNGQFCTGSCYQNGTCMHGNNTTIGTWQIFLDQLLCYFSNQ